MPSSAMKPTEAGHRQVFARDPQREDAADERERHVGEDQRRLAHGSQRGEQHQEDEPERDRHHHGETCCCAPLVFELAAPDQAVARRQLDLVRDRLLRILDEADEVAPRHVGLHDGEARGVLAIDLDGAGGAAQLGHVADAYEAAVAGRELSSA